MSHPSTEMNTRITGAIIDTKKRREIKEKGEWGNKWEFLLSCIGLSVGIGNVWRFPYLAFQNGGGAFLIPYLFMLVFAGKPMYFLELSFGQFSGHSPVSTWACVPIAKGVGWSMFFVSLTIAIYYCVIMSYTLFYLVASLQSVLPWSYCLPEWEKYNCINISQASNLSYGIISTQVYWEHQVLDKSSSIGNPGIIKFDLAMYLLASWIIVIFCIVRGIKTSGKVVYFAATFPYVILLTLLVTGLMQPGAMTGVLYFLTPQWEKILEISVWQAAAGQMFYSLAISIGSLIMYSSYNDFRHNVFRDALVVSIMDTITSIIAGLVIFSILGALAHDLNTDISTVVKSGSGLAFVAYPAALLRLPYPQVGSCLFFAMLFILGLSTEFALLENVISSILDEVPKLRRHRTLVCFILFVFCYLVGLSCVTQGGSYVLNIFDYYGGTASLIFIGLAEIISISWIYGVKQFCLDVEFMLNKKINIFWKITWSFTTPLILSIVFVISLFHLDLLVSEEYEWWADLVGIMLACFIILQVPIWAIIMIYKAPGHSISKKFKNSLKPTSKWGPKDKSLMVNWKLFKAMNEEDRDVIILEAQSSKEKSRRKESVEEPDITET